MTATDDRRLAELFDRVAKLEAAQPKPVEEGRVTVEAGWEPVPGEDYTNTIPAEFGITVLTPEASAAILADPSWQPVTRSIEVGDRVHHRSDVNLVGTVAHNGVNWDDGGFTAAGVSPLSLVAPEDAAYTPPAPKPSWHDARAVIDKDGDVWSRHGEFWFCGARLLTTAELERSYGPIRTLVDRDGRTILTEEEIVNADAEYLREDEFVYETLRRLHCETPEGGRS